MGYDTSADYLEEESKVKQYRWERRERKQKAERNRMKKSGRSVFVIQEQMNRRMKRGT